MYCRFVTKCASILLVVFTTGIQLFAFQDLVDTVKISEQTMQLATLQDNRPHTLVLFNDQPIAKTGYFYSYDAAESVFLPLIINADAGVVSTLHWTYNPFQEFRLYSVTLNPKQTLVLSFQNGLQVNSQSLWYTDNPHRIPACHPSLQNEIAGNYLELVICGMMFMMWLYITLKYVQLRTQEYLFYSLYILFSFLHFLTVMLAKVSVEWYSNPMEREFYHRFFQTLSHAAYFQFFRYFTRTHTDQPRFDQVLTLATLGAFVYILFDVGMVFAVADPHVPLEAIWVYVRLAFVLFVAISLIFWVSRSKSPLRNYLIIGNVFLITGGVLTMIFNPYREWIAHWVVPFAFPLFYYRAGVLLEIICFSLGLGFKQKLEDRKRQEAESRLQREQLEVAKIKEVDAAKSAFFANISHEFRTPLTLIQAPADKILAETGDRFEKEVGLIKRNSEDLLKLINQVLELSRLEDGKWTINVQPIEQNKFFTRVCEPFEFMAQQKSQRWQIHLPKLERIVLLDPDAVEKITNNLVTNAIKYSPPGSRVSLHVENADGVLEWCVEDSGPGIPAEKLPFIFDRYYRGVEKMEGGMGIGLAYTNELVKGHNGNIDVTSEIGRGTRFIVRIPVQIIQPGDGTQAIFENDSLQHTAVSHKPLLLLVEDNDELRSFLATELSHHYQVLAVDRSNEAWEMAQREVPDIVLSDWMMPGMTGMELCAKLKSSDITNHIPVVLLTARASEAARLEGWQTGADDYIVKPFQLDELKLRLKNLIDQRMLLKTKYSKTSPSVKKLVSNLSVEEKFLERVRVAIERHIANTQFSVEVLAEEVNLGKVQLYRKITAIAGCAPAEFIRNYRLDRAAELLRQSAGNVSEVAWKTGFESQSHFARVYRERFGYPPSQTPKTDVKIEK